MKKISLFALILIIIVVILTPIILGYNIGDLGDDLKNLFFAQYETVTYDIDEAFTSLCIDTDTADVHLLVAEDGKSKVTVYKRKNESFNVSVSKGELCIESNESKVNFSFNFESPKITVYLPEGEYESLDIQNDTGDVILDGGVSFDRIDVTLDTGDAHVFESANEYINIAAETGNVHIQGAKYGAASIKTDTGDVTLKDVICDNDISITNDTGKITVSSLECNGKIGLTVDTGKVFITNATCNDLSSVGSTGDINLINVVVSEKMSIERGTGDVLLESCDGGEILITTDTGDVRGSLLSDKIFITNTNTGRVNVPETTSGGKCKITTDTGNIIIEIE